jgi:hypothetical protein
VPPRILYRCPCPACREPAPSPTKDQHARVGAFLAALTPEQRRLFAGLESLRLGPLGDGEAALVTGLSPDAVAQGRRELEQARAAAEGPAYDPENHRAKKARLLEDWRAARHGKYRPPPPQHKAGADGPA